MRPGLPTIIRRRGAALAAAMLVVFSALVGAAADSARTVKDPLGRTLRVPVDPQRVVALAPSITEIVYALKEERRLVGTANQSDHPPEAAALPKVGSYIHLDVERIVALRPDLCIGVKDGNPLATVEQLQALGISVFAVDPNNLSSVIESISAIGDLLNAAPRARTITTDMRARIERVKTRVAKAPRKPRIFFQLAVAPIVSVGSDTFIHDLIVTAGGANVAQGSAPYPRFSREQVIALAPEVLVISSMQHATLFEQVKAEWLQWPAIPAVARNAVFIAPPNAFDRPSPRLVESLELLAGYIHPDLFKAQP